MIKAFFGLLVRTLAIVKFNIAARPKCLIPQVNIPIQNLDIAGMAEGYCAAVPDGKIQYKFVIAQDDIPALFKVHRSAPFRAVAYKDTIFNQNVLAIIKEHCAAIF